jgi:molybdopterin converting factor subunit 1
VTITVQLFAVARQRAGTSAVQLDLPEPATVAHLRQALVRRVPDLAPLAGHLMFAIHSEYAPDEATIPPGAQVACIPPVSGG